MRTNPPRDGNRPRRAVKAPIAHEPSESPDDSPPGDDRAFEAMTAFENLVCRMVDLEALAHAAEQAAQSLPYTREPELRRTIRHVQALICLLATLSTRALSEADDDLVALGTSPNVAA